MRHQSLLCSNIPPGHHSPVATSIGFIHFTLMLMLTKFGGNCVYRSSCSNILYVCMYHYGMDVYMTCKSPTPTPPKAFASLLLIWHQRKHLYTAVRVSCNQSHQQHKHIADCCCRRRYQPVPRLKNMTIVP